MSFYNTLTLLRKFVGPFSIVNENSFVELNDSNEKFYLYKSRLNCFAKNMKSPQVLYCFGFSKDKNEAELKALGESIERYSGINFALSEGSYKSLKYLDLPVILPTDCVLYSEKQYNSTNFPYSKFQVEKPYYWINAYDCQTSEPHMIHGDFVAMQSEGELTKASSIGMALHSNKDKAIESAIYECIERDHLALVFFSKIKCKRIPLSFLGSNLSKHLESMLKDGLELYCLHIRFDINVNVILWLGFNKEKAPFFIKGAASHINLKLAVEKSFEEMFRSFLYYKIYPFQIYKNPTGVLKNLMYYQYPTVKEKFNYLIGEEYDDVSDIENVIDENTSIIDKIYSAGFKAYWVDMLPNHLKTNNLFCVRAIVPGLVKTPLGNEPWSLGMKRLYKFRNVESEYIESTIEPHFFS